MAARVEQGSLPLTAAPSGAFGNVAIASAAPVAAVQTHQPQTAPVRWVAAAALSENDIATWHGVAAQAAQPNIFASPAMVLPALTALDTDHRATIAFVHDAAGMVIGVAPIVAKTLPGRITLPAVGDWGHANGFLSAIAVTAGREECFWDQLITALPAHSPAARCIAIDGLVAHAPIHAGLVAAAAKRGAPVTVDQRIVRAMLATQLDAESYWNDAVRPKKRKELRRQWARLAEQGVVSHGAVDLSGNGYDWVDEFLQLEASGWKGRHGSALSSAPGTENFFRAAMANVQASGQLCVTALRLDGRAIAMLITLTDRDAGFSFKTAFDEDYARFSPGVLLQREALALLRARNLAWIDSCAAPDHPMIDSLWRERRTVVRVSMPLPGLVNRLTYHAVVRATRAWHAIKAGRATPAMVQEPDQ